MRAVIIVVVVFAAKSWLASETSLSLLPGLERMTKNVLNDMLDTKTVRDEFERGVSAISNDIERSASLAGVVLQECGGCGCLCDGDECMTFVSVATDLGQ